MKLNSEILTDVITLAGLADALHCLTWEGPNPETQGAVAALIRTIKAKSAELTTTLESLPDEPQLKGYPND